MKNLPAILLMGISLNLFQCKLPTASDAPNLVTSFHFTPSAFDSFRRNSEMKYSLASAATVNAYIVQKDSGSVEHVVKTLVEGLSETKGAHAITWIGDTDTRLFAPAGIYFGILRIQDRRFETIVQVYHL